MRGNLKRLFYNRIALFIGSLWCVCCMANCDRDCGPPEKSILRKNYPIYFLRAGNANSYFVLHSTSLQIDTVPLLLHPIRDFESSVDGTRIYISVNDSIAVVDASTGSVLRWLHNGTNSARPAFESSDGSLLALTGGDTLKVLSTIDFTLVIADTARINAGDFSPNGKYLLGKAADHLLRLDLESGHVERFYNVLDAQTAALISSYTGDSCYQYSNPSFDAWDLRGISLATGTRFYWRSITPGYGDIVRSHDARFLAISNPGRSNSFLPGDQFLSVVDTRNGFSGTIVSTVGFPDNEPEESMTPGILLFLPDGRLVAASSTNYVTGEVFIYDSYVDSMLIYLDLGLPQVVNLTGPAKL